MVDTMFVKSEAKSCLLNCSQLSYCGTVPEKSLFKQKRTGDCYQTTKK